jgi:DNA-binding Lrp family transcriptional regulator
MPDPTGGATTGVGGTPDATDRALIALLKENARTPVADLARRVGLSRTTVQSRLERLERTGVISRYTVVLADALETGAIRAHILVSAPTRAAAGVEAALRRIPEVKTVHSVSGAFDMIVIAAADTVAAMDAVIDRIGVLDGVERTTSSIILSTRLDRR